MRSSFARWAKVRPEYTSLPPSPGLDSEKTSEDGLLLPDGEILFQVKRSSLWKKPVFLASHIGLLAFYIISLLLVSGVWTNGVCPRNKGMPFSPATSALEYSEKTLSYLESRISESSEFVGRPSPALDKAWHDLLQIENIAVDRKYLEHIGRADTAVAIPDGGGYLATLNVYHELHCLKRIHRSLYADYYWPNQTAEAAEMMRLHNEHCIDYLRQVAMCHGDVGLITYEWGDFARFPVANATTHQCVDWNKIEDFQRAHTVDVLKPNWLVHPVFGPVSTDGTGQVG